MPLTVYVNRASLMDHIWFNFNIYKHPPHLTTAIVCVLGRAEFVVDVKAVLSLSVVKGTGFPLDNPPSTTHHALRQQENLFHTVL